MPATYKRQLILCAIGIAGILLFILTTNPAVISVGLLLVLPMLVALTTFACARLMLQIFSGLSATKRTALSSVCAVGPTLIVILGSLGQLGVQDFMLACLLVGGLYWYIKRVQAVRQ